MVDITKLTLQKSHRFFWRTDPCMNRNKDNLNHVLMMFVALNGVFVFETLLVKVVCKSFVMLVFVVFRTNMDWSASLRFAVVNNLLRENVKEYGRMNDMDEYAVRTFSVSGRRAVFYKKLHTSDSYLCDK